MRPQDPEYKAGKHKEKTVYQNSEGSREYDHLLVLNPLPTGVRRLVNKAGFKVYHYIGSPWDLMDMVQE